MSSSYRQELDRWLIELVVKADTVIDIGGAQQSVKERVKEWDVKKYLIADLPSPHKGAMPDIICDLNGHADTKVKADLVFCLEVFEYVYDPVNAMHIISRMLKPNGTVWISWPLVYPVHQPIEDDSLRYTIHGMERIAAAAGLKLAHYQLRRPLTSIAHFYGLEGMRAAKGIDHEVTGYIAKFKRAL
jgi:SAM-dependent methyltransferase